MPIRTLDGYMIKGQATVKIHHMIEEGLSFVALVQGVNDNKITLVTNFDGEVKELVDGLKEIDILKYEEIITVLAELRK